MAWFLPFLVTIRNTDTLLISRAGNDELRNHVETQARSRESMFLSHLSAIPGRGSSLSNISNRVDVGSKSYPGLSIDEGEPSRSQIQPKKITLAIFAAYGKVPHSARKQTQFLLRPFYFMECFDMRQWDSSPWRAQKSETLSPCAPKNPTMSRPFSFIPSYHAGLCKAFNSFFTTKWSGMGSNWLQYQVERRWWPVACLQPMGGDNELCILQGRAIIYIGAAIGGVDPDGCLSRQLTARDNKRKAWTVDCYLSKCSGHKIMVSTGSAIDWEQFRSFAKAVHMCGCMDEARQCYDLLLFVLYTSCFMLLSPPPQSVSNWKWQGTSRSGQHFPVHFRPFDFCVVRPWCQSCGSPILASKVILVPRAHVNFPWCRWHWWWYLSPYVVWLSWRGTDCAISFKTLYATNHLSQHLTNIPRIQSSSFTPDFRI